MRRSAIEREDELALALLMNKNFKLRRQVFGDAALGEANLAMVKCTWSVNGEVPHSIAARQEANYQQHPDESYISTSHNHLQRHVSEALMHQDSRDTASWFAPPLQSCYGPLLLHAAAAKFTGSGGAIVALCPEGEPQEAALQAACEREGFVCTRVQVCCPHQSPALLCPNVLLPQPQASGSSRSAQSWGPQGCRQA